MHNNLVFGKGENFFALTVFSFCVILGKPSEQVRAAGLTRNLIIGEMLKQVQHGCF